MQSLSRCRVGGKFRPVTNRSVVSQFESKSVGVFTRRESFDSR